MKYMIYGAILWLIVFDCALAQNPADVLAIHAFHQGKANNCASVALIKAAMLKYGYKHMFQVTSDGTGYNIRLQDGTVFTLSADDIDRAGHEARFVVDPIAALGVEQDSVLLYAELAYACIAKDISVNGYWGSMETGSRHFTKHNTFRRALGFISNTSYATDYCFRYLGLQVKDPSVPDFKDPTAIAGETGVILYSCKHAVVAYQGQLDCFGHWIPVAKDTCDTEFKWYLILK